MGFRRFVCHIAIGCMATLALPVSAQDAAFSPLVMELGDGGVARSLAAVVRSADLIVLGRYGEYLGNAPFHGYADPLTGAGRSQRGIPLSEYTIEIEEVLKGGQLLPETLILRLPELPDDHLDSGIAQQREGRHLFFFALNPDRRTVGLPGPESDLKETEDAFTVYAAGKARPLPGSRPKQTFLANVRSLSQPP